MDLSIPKNIRRLRRQAGLTQQQFAEKLFVTRQTVSLWEVGKTQPDIQTLENIAEVFQVDLMTVLYGVSSPKEQQLQQFLRGPLFPLSLWLFLLFLTEGSLELGNLARDQNWPPTWSLFFGKLFNFSFMTFFLYSGFP